MKRIFYVDCYVRVSTILAVALSSAFDKNYIIDDNKSMQKLLDYIMTSKFKKLFNLKDVIYRDNELAFKNKEDKKIYV